MNAQTKCNNIQTKIGKKEAKYNAVIKHSKANKSIIIDSSYTAVRKTVIYYISYIQQIKNVPLSLVSVDSSEVSQFSVNRLQPVDFSQLSEDMKSRTESDINKLRASLTTAVEELQKEMAAIENCNFKVCASKIPQYQPMK